jgi:hypothetical protein
MFLKVIFYVNDFVILEQVFVRVEFRIMIFLDGYFISLFLYVFYIVIYYYRKVIKIIISFIYPYTNTNINIIFNINN